MQELVLAESTAEQPEGVAAMAALAAEVERLRRLVLDHGQVAAEARAAAALVGGQLSDVRGDVAALDALRTQVRVLADRVAELATRVVASAEPGFLVSWFDATPEQAVQLLDNLAVWLAEVGVQYRQVRLALSDCWFRHPGAVEALNSLRLAWFVAYQSPLSAASAAVDWHVRLLPGVAGLVESELRGCSDANHAPEGSFSSIDAARPLPPVGDRRLAEHALWWTSVRPSGQEARETEAPSS